MGLMNNIDKLEKFILGLVGENESLEWNSAKPEILKQRMNRNEVRNSIRAKLAVKLEKMRNGK